MKYYCGLITTQSIAEGESREAGLTQIVRSGGSIIFAQTSVVWPGEASTLVDLISICRGISAGPKVLQNKNVNSINSFLQEGEEESLPFELARNTNKCFQGSVPNGSGFFLSPELASSIIIADQRNKEVIFPFLIADDVNGDYEQTPSRWIINFSDWSRDKAAEYVIPFSIVREKVQPLRAKSKDKNYRDKWWQFARNAKGMYVAIDRIDCYMVAAIHTKYINFAFRNDRLVLDHGLVGIALNDYESYGILQSSIHEVWARKYGTTLGGTARYNPTDCFQNFPFCSTADIQVHRNLVSLGRKYFGDRRDIMRSIKLGLTDFYNTVHYQDINVEFFETQFGQPQSIAESTYDAILNFRNLQKQLDGAVVTAYGWHDLDLEHGFHEVEYLPENDRVRYTISGRARKEVLRRLLKLNHEIHEDEVKKGLWAEKKGAKGKKIAESKTRDDNQFPLGV